MRWSGLFSFWSQAIFSVKFLGKKKDNASFAPLGLSPANGPNSSSLPSLFLGVSCFPEPAIHASLRVATHRTVRNYFPTQPTQVDECLSAPRTQSHMQTSYMHVQTSFQTPICFQKSEGKEVTEIISPWDVKGKITPWPS